MSCFGFFKEVAEMILDRRGREIKIGCDSRDGVTVQESREDIDFARGKSETLDRACQVITFAERLHHEDVPGFAGEPVQAQEKRVADRERRRIITRRAVAELRAHVFDHLAYASVEDAIVDQRSGIVKSRDDVASDDAQRAVQHDDPRSHAASRDRKREAFGRGADHALECVARSAAKLSCAEASALLEASDGARVDRANVATATPFASTPITSASDASCSRAIGNTVGKGRRSERYVEKASRNVARAARRSPHEDDTVNANDSYDSVKTATAQSARSIVSAAVSMSRRRSPSSRCSREPEAHAVGVVRVSIGTESSLVE